MKNKDALMIANCLLCEIRILLSQDKIDQARRVAEIGQTLPVDEDNITREMLTYDKLFDYMSEHPDRQELLHFHALRNLEPRMIAEVAT